jgi:NAD-dependent deacetylase
MNQELITRAAEILRDATFTAILTGAGIGRPSGIPDFRSESGLWSKDDPMEAASMRTFLTNPQRFYDWLRPLMDMMLAAEPNPAHLALAELERMDKLQAVITQNIDYLHQRAGSHKVYELHGNINTASCLKTGERISIEPLIDEVRAGNVPRDPDGNPYKPDIVLFGEALPEHALIQSHVAAERSKAFLVVGTSLEVYPAASLPMIAAQNGARMMVVNLGETYMDQQAEVVIRDDVATALPAIVAALKEMV